MSKDQLTASVKDTYQGTRQEVLAEFSKVSAALGILAARTIERPLPDENDAVAVFMGLGEQERLAEAVRLWTQRGSKHLFIAGVNPIEEDHPSAEQILDRVVKYGGGNNLKNVHILEAARHTKDQADWLAQRVGDEGIGKLVLVDPDYHVPRAYATITASMDAAANDTPMWTSSIDYPAGYITPGNRYPGIKQDPIFMAREDARRIPLYQKTGDVASDEAWNRRLGIG